MKSLERSSGRILTILFLILISILSPIFPADFIYPIKNVKPRITSTFGEYRPSMTEENPHFHMGIDLSTAYKSGVPILSVADGYIRRIDVDDNDIYGYTVYVVYNDEYIFMYAHLSNFSEKVRYFAESVKREFGNNRVEIYFPKGVLKVKKGEVIGYSGETGEAIAPHCHLEVRSLDGRKSIDPISLIDSLPEPNADLEILGLRINDEEFEPNGKVYRFEGERANLEINARLKTDANVLGIHSIEMYMDGKKVYELRFDEIDLNDFERADELFGRRSNASNYWYKLYAPSDLSVVKMNEIPMRFPDSSNVKIIVGDDWGRKSILTFKLVRR